jgi:glycine cleavage system H lipoate-binding protein
MKIWYLKHPLTLYKESKEEIKKLAKDNGFKIIDSVFGSNDLDVPNLTLVSEINEEIKEIPEVIELKKRGRKPKETTVDNIG